MRVACALATLALLCYFSVGSAEESASGLAQLGERESALFLAQDGIIQRDKREARKKKKKNNKTRGRKRSKTMRNKKNKKQGKRKNLKGKKIKKNLAKKKGKKNGAGKKRRMKKGGKKKRKNLSGKRKRKGKKGKGRNNKGKSKKHMKRKNKNNKKNKKRKNKSKGNGKKAKDADKESDKDVDENLIVIVVKPTTTSPGPTTPEPTTTSTMMGSTEEEMMEMKPTPPPNPPPTEDGAPPPPPSPPGPVENGKCITDMVSTALAYGNLARNLFRIATRAMNFAKVTAQKLGKTEEFVPALDMIVAAAGGDAAAPMCSGAPASAPIVAIIETLTACPDKIAAECLPKDEAVLAPVQECLDTINEFRAMYTAKVLKPDGTEAKCAGVVELAPLKQAVMDCKAIVEEAEPKMKEIKTKCFNEFGGCRSSERDALLERQNC